MRMRPESGGSRHPSRCSRVLLPQPEGPMIATSSPRRTEKLTLSTTGRGVWEMLKPLLRLSAITISGSIAPPSWSGCGCASDIQEQSKDAVDDTLQEALAGGFALGPSRHLVGGGGGHHRHRGWTVVGVGAGAGWLSTVRGQ